MKNLFWKIYLLSLLLMAMFIPALCNGCAVETEAATNYERFTREYAGSSCYIITDNDTGVQYLAYDVGTLQGRGAGLTKLEVSDGNDK